MNTDVQDYTVVLINSWYFDFNNMIAFRKNNDVTDIRQIVSAGSSPSILKKRFNLKEPLTNFFSEPEEHFNNKIDQAYHEYLLTKSIEEILQSDLK